MRNSTRPLALGAIVIVGIIGFLIYQGISNNLVYYVTPSELLAKHPASGESFRLGGQVRPGTVHFDSARQTLSFVLQDPKGRLPVVSHGQPPQLFQAGAGAVVEGTYANGTFDATNLMIKHGNSYRVPAPGKTPVPDSYSSTP